MNSFGFPFQSLVSFVDSTFFNRIIDCYFNKLEGFSDGRMLNGSFSLGNDQRICECTQKEEQEAMTEGEEWRYKLYFGTPLPLIIGMG